MLRCEAGMPEQVWFTAFVPLLNKSYSGSSVIIRGWRTFCRNPFSFNLMSRKLGEELKLSFGNNIQLSICFWISTTSRPSDEIWLQPQNSFRFCFFTKKKLYPAAWGLKNNSPNHKLEDSVLIVVKQRHRAIVLMPLMRKNEPQGRIFGKGYYNACQFLKQSRLPILQFFGSTLDFQKHYEF